MQICSFLSSYNWLLTITSLDIDSATLALYDALHFCVLNFVPEVEYKPSKFPSWFSRDLKSIVLEKKRKHAQYKSTHCPRDYSDFSTLRAQYKTEYKKCYSAFLSRTENQLNQNPRLFWDFVRKHKSTTEIPNSVFYNDVTSSGPESIPYIFSSYFKSIYVPNFRNNNGPVTHFSHHNLPSDCIFSIKDVEDGLAALKNVKSTGPDGLSGTFLFNIRSALCYPLWLLFRRSMDLGVFPKMLKMSSVTPVFKSGNKSDVKNYRPISILSHIAKLFELLVLRSIQPSVNNILIDEQYGFRPGRSAVSNLIVLNNYILKAFDKHSQVDVIFTDFAKAFDRVDHHTLMDILYKSGFGEPILSWLKSYISGRVQWVKVFGHISNAIEIPSGVPQGGHLSPIIFSLFVNGLKNVIPYTKFLMFADDLKIFSQVDTLNDCHSLQNELNSIVSWFNSIGLQFNNDKCHSMSFSRNRSIISYTYAINGSTLESVSMKKDLGVILTPKLNYHPHIEAMCCKSLKTLGFVLRLTKEFKLSASLKSIYCSLVRSLLEYASVLWDPCTAVDSSLIERVQRRFLNSAAFTLKINHPPHDYQPVMHKLDLVSLADRRVEANLLFLRKLIDGYIDAPSLLSQISFKVPSRPTRSSAPFAITAHNTNYGRNQPIDRMMRLGNEHPHLFNSY